MAAAAASAEVYGQEKVMAAAKQIVQSITSDRDVAEDMIRILSAFDNRFSDLLSGDAKVAGAVEGFSSLHLAEDSQFDGRRAAEGVSNPEDGESSQLDMAVTPILHWDSIGLDCLLWEAPRDEIDEYLYAIDQILSFLGGGSGSCDEHHVRGHAVLQAAMSRLEEEYRHLMIRNTVALEPHGLYSSIRRRSISIASDGGDTVEDFETSVEEQQQEGSLEERRASRSRSASGGALLEDWNVVLIHPEAVSELKEIAERMIRASYGRELCQVHCSVRGEVLDECLSVLGVHKMSIEEVQRLEWSELNDQMKKWIQAVKIMIQVVLVEESRVCDHMFEESDELREECFSESAKGCVMQLLNFGDAVSIGRRSAEKLFGILDMCEALTDVLPNLRELFLQHSSQFICDEAECTLSRLGNAVKGILAEFGKAVQGEPSRKVMQGCEIHPLTRYVMNYLKLLVVYNSSLDVLLDNGGVNGGECIEEGESMTPTSRRLLLLISYLESNLEEKSKLYEDGGMQYIFLMNNLLYIVQKVKDSELRTFLGDDWIRKRRGRIRQYSTGYLRTSWTKVLSYLKDDGLSGSGSFNSVSRTALKERFKNFNLAFEELHKTQAALKVPDLQLREELKISISEKIIPAYRSFMGRFGSHLEGGRHAAKYLKYTLDDIDKCLVDLFEGKAGASSYPRRKISS